MTTRRPAPREHCHMTNIPRMLLSPHRVTQHARGTFSSRNRSAVFEYASFLFIMRAHILRASVRRRRSWCQTYPVTRMAAFFFMTQPAASYSMWPSLESQKLVQHELDGFTGVHHSRTRHLGTVGRVVAHVLPSDWTADGADGLVRTCCRVGCTSCLMSRLCT